MLATYSMIVPDAIPGVPAVVVVHISHTMLIVDTHGLLATYTTVAVTSNADILKVIQN